MPDHDFGFALHLLVPGIEAMAERGIQASVAEVEVLPAPYVVEFTESPDEPLTWTDRIRALTPASPGAPSSTRDLPLVPSAES